MKIKDYKCKCGHNDFFFADKSNQKGIYCSYCGKWLKWADKDEQNLAMKSENDINKLRAEIKGMYRVILKDTPKDDWAVRWNDCLDEVLEIVDKYRIEPVLDKVRAEISALKSHHINDCYDDGFQGCRTNVLQIIDKYKSEGEKENEIQR